MEKYTKQELIGQKLLVGFDGKEVDQHIKDLIQKYKVGGFILYRNNYDTYEEFISLIKKLKEINRVNRIPLFICIDQENGIVNRLPNEFHRIKNALALSKCNLDVVREAGALTAEILHRSGVNVNLAPTVDIYDEKITKSIGNRCFGESSDEVIKNARVIIEEHNKNGVIPIIKHYPGLRKERKDSHIFLSALNKIEDEDIKPFLTLMKENAPGILLGHIRVRDKDKLPVSISKKIHSEIVNDYKYNGITITDDLKMRSVRYRYGALRIAKLALESGNDIIMFNYPKNKELKVINMFYKMYKEHKNEIDDSAYKIIELKKKYKINDNDFKELSIDEINEYNKKIDNNYNIVTSKSDL